MALEGTEFTTPVGRIVWGHPLKSKSKTDQQNKPVIGADGQPVQEWSFGVAFDKATFQSQIWPVLAAEAAKGYPNGVPQGFSWKYKDGDGVDKQGKLYSDREGHAGCYVLAISTVFQSPSVFKYNGTGYDQLPAEAIKCGDYVSCGLNIKVNIPTNVTHTPGIYVNPLAIEFVAYGSEIVGQGAADPNALFGGRQHQLPPGASATPVAAAGAPGMPGMGGHMQPPGQPAPQMQQPPMQPAPVAPGYPQQPAPVMAPPPAPPAPAAPMRPTDPSHISPDGRGGELWWNGAAWAPAPVAAAPAALPPPAPDFIPGQPAAPGMPQMPGMMPPR